MLRDFTKEKFDIIIQAGQSNAEGAGFGPIENPYIPNEAVWYLQPDFTLTMAAERTRENEVISDFSLSFAREYLENGLLEDGRKLMILRTAVGGTGFRDNHWKLTDDLYLRMMEMIRTALSLNPENRLVAFLWHQGETDALLGAGQEEHYQNLQNLLTSVRTSFDVPVLPFIAGDFVHDWRDDNKEICAPVLGAIREFCQVCGHGGFVETDGLHSNSQGESYFEKILFPGDTIHFTRHSLYLLGKRYFEMFLKLRA